MGVKKPIILIQRFSFHSSVIKICSTFALKEPIWVSKRVVFLPWGGVVFVCIGKLSRQLRNMRRKWAGTVNTLQEISWNLIYFEAVFPFHTYNSHNWIWELKMWYTTLYLIAEFQYTHCSDVLECIWIINSMALDHLINSL